MEKRQRNLRGSTDEIIGAAIEVHRYLGPGLLESTYEECFCHELHLRQIPFQRQLLLPINYKGIRIEDKHRIDILVRDSIVIELKAIEAILPVHHAQLLSYLRLGGWSIGLLMNFHVPMLVDGIHRKVWNHED